MEEAEHEQEKFRQELEAILNERQWVITQARKGKITEEDMDYQLGALALQETYLKQEVSNLGIIQNSRLLGGWEKTARE